MSTFYQTPSSAAHAVFATAELLEQIFLELPLRNLVSSRRVSEQWADTIKDSPKLHGRSVFRRPMPNRSETVTMNPKFPRKTSMPSSKALRNLEEGILDAKSPSHIAIDHKALSKMEPASRLELISQPPIRKVTFWCVFSKGDTLDGRVVFKEKVKKFGQGATFETLAGRLERFFSKAREHRATTNEHKMVDFVWLDFGDVSMDRNCGEEGLEDKLGRLKL
ncbi:uncharacterized protein MYCFIDRAFT_195551 [Pseudocercospora fijiensis CIRAD86]|uniref:F-box domain-containing protein n=1 Tax=Pseudocercospora fijiensis (strain CIRAD86) TaxID=383855 RepID=M3AIW0_PSEFD|nr:uncharacterized protein MYCFIDRAFT_195551 [Pseudocercospora fijiensis CIRAD86]EME84531.1 hypothetical protein MYCFIDRAFT_195551 [Pseudocercospora fijiensis CIRAD86]